MAYKIVRRVRGTSVSNPAVCITKDSIRFNAAARKAFGIDNYTHAELYQDEEKLNKHSIRLMGQESEDGKRMKLGGISAKEWANSINLPKGVFPVDMADDNEMVEFDTDQALPARKSKGESAIREVKPRFKKAA